MKCVNLSLPVVEWRAFYAVQIFPVFSFSSGILLIIGDCLCSHVGGLYFLFVGGGDWGTSSFSNVVIVKHFVAESEQPTHKLKTKGSYSFCKEN